MGRNPETNREQREQTRAQLLAAAVRLFAEHGVDRVSVAQVAAAANVSKGLVYHYFATKADLVSAVLEKRVADVAALVASLPPGLSEAEQLRAFAGALLASVRADPEGYRMLLRTLAHPEGGEAIRQVVRSREAVFRERAASFAQLFGRLGSDDPALDARFFQAAMVGILVLQVTSPLAQSSDRLVERLLQAVGVGGER